jgi:hypothetical protein
MTKTVACSKQNVATPNPLLEARLDAVRQWVASWKAQPKLKQYEAYWLARLDGAGCIEATRLIKCNAKNGFGFHKHTLKNGFTNWQRTEEIKKLLLDGKSIAEITTLVKVSESTVVRLRRQLKVES